MNKANSCFLTELSAVIDSRKKASPDDSYVAGLLAKGGDAVLRKITEEATEVILAAKAGDRREIIHEVADLWFHCLVLLSAWDLDAQAVMDELISRRSTKVAD